ncbi:MAG TPA: hypothetical protein VNE86_04170 [Nitrososphaerales archaeon]|nr:hypothetical protein [Nitrososphaerales archaeon]
MTPRELASYVQPEQDDLGHITGYPIFAFNIQTATFKSWDKEFKQEIIDLQNSSNRILMAKVFRQAHQAIVQRLCN